MNDVEELLRDTLADPRRRLAPSGGMYESVRHRAHDIRRNRWALASGATAVLAVLAVASTVAVNRADHRAQTAHQPSPSAIAPTQPRNPSRGAVGGAVDLGQGSPSDAVATSEGIYVVANNPAELVKLDAAGTRIEASTSLGANSNSAVIVTGGHVWVWSQSPGEVFAFSADTLKPLASYTTGASIFQVVEVDGYLYLTTDHGLLRASAVIPTDHQPTPGSSGDLLAATKVAGIEGLTHGLAADPARHRVLVGVTDPGSAPSDSFAGARVVALDARTGDVVATGVRTSVGKESIAVVGDQVWVGGYGDTDKPRIGHLDATTLQKIGTSPVGAQVGPGAILWPGENVLWVRNGGDTTLSCVDPRTGAILQQWLAVQGPVASVRGHAYGIQAGLQPLILNGACTG